MALFNAPKNDAPKPAASSSGGGKGKKGFTPDVPMPDGTHKATAVRVLPKMTSTGKHMFTVKWEDDFHRAAWQNIIISPESEKAMKFLYSRIMPVFGLTQAIIEAEDTTPDDIANDMTGCEALITVETEVYNDKRYTKVRWLDAA